MSPDAGRYFAGGIQNSCQPGFVHDFLQSRLPSIIERRVRGWSDHDCLLAELGDFLVAVMDITSDVAQGLVTGSHISAYASSRGPLLTPDLSTSDYLEDKHEALVNIHSVISKTAKDINQLWQDSPLLPSPPSPLELPDQLFQHQSSSSLPFRSLASPSSIAGMITRDEMLYSSRPSGNEHASRPDSRPPLDNHTQRNDDVDDETSANKGYRPVERDGQITEPYSASIEEVRARGTGYYKCPHGLSCAKGGVHSDDTIRIFTRNSDFKAHMMKHERLYKCDHPSCGKAFGRPDHLKRHRDKRHRDKRHRN